MLTQTRNPAGTKHRRRNRNNVHRPERIWRSEVQQMENACARHSAVRRHARACSARLLVQARGQCTRVRVLPPGRRRPPELSGPEEELPVSRRHLPNRPPVSGKNARQVAPAFFSVVFAAEGGKVCHAPTAFNHSMPKNRSAK